MIQKKFEWYSLIDQEVRTGCDETSVMELPNGVLIRERSFDPAVTDVPTMALVFVPSCCLHIDADGTVCIIGPEPGPPPPPTKEDYF